MKKPKTETWSRLEMVFYTVSNSRMVDDRRILTKQGGTGPIVITEAELRDKYTKEQNN